MDMVADMSNLHDNTRDFLIFSMRCYCSYFSKIVIFVSKRAKYAQSEVRSREYRFPHVNRFTVDIPFLSKALSGERI